MARIRSVHPGQWTDEDFVSCSPYARLLALALRNEADDNGIFEWKPVGLKMRIFPVDNLEMVPLLEELGDHNQICSYEINGRKYGAIRNFCKYQRPKKPNCVHLMPDEFRTYVGLSSSSTELKPADAGSIPQKLELAPQRKEEGGRRKKNGLTDRSFITNDSSTDSQEYAW